MAALTSIRNPSRVKETLLFFCTDNKEVGLEILEPEKPPRDGPRGMKPGGENLRLPTANTGTDDTVSGLVKHPGSMVAVVFQQLIRVYGILEKGEISLVSPGVLKLTRRPTTKKNALAGCTDGESLGWLYYLNTDDPPKLYQYKLDNFSNAAVGPQATPDPETTLSAYYKCVDQSRVCIYQMVGKKDLYYYEVTGDGNSNNGKIDNSSNAAKKTPIATAVIDNNAYCYYINDDSHIVRTVREGSGKWTNSIEATDNTWSLGPITAVAALDGTSITVRQAYENDDGFMTWVDTSVGQ